VKPRELADAAETVLSSTAVGGCWPRAAALLARQSIETSLDVVWRARAPGVSMCSIHAQLLLLPIYLSDQTMARSAAYAWAALTRACHHHAYELAPTLSELRSLIRLARELANMTAEAH
jgi:hypothetical protein